MEKIVVGMSGGVDSSVAAYLLKQQGYEVIGVTMQMWTEAESDAGKVAEQLGIKHYVLDFRKEFKSRVIDNFIEEYCNCRTPNPCNRCNRMMKWEALLEWAKTQGIHQIATGHYAKMVQLQNGRYTVTDAVSKAKDQTYALCRLTQEQLSATRMPVGDYSKDEIRAIATKIGLVVADKPDSQDICFVPDGDYGAFIQKYAEVPITGEGNFVDKEGQVLGRHKGLLHYTIGQRKGLNLAMGEPVYVTGLHPETNEVVIGTNEDVFSDTLIAKDLNAMAVPSLSEEMECMAKIRYAHPGAKCKIYPVEKDRIKVVFEEKQRAITPGQSVVFYDTMEEKRVVLGSGIIC